MTGPAHDQAVQAELEAANRAFYEAFESSDFDTMESLWSDDDAVVCAHPGMQPIHGRRNVMRAWMALMARDDYLQFFLTDVEVALAGDGRVATVSCKENVLAADDNTPDEAFAGATAYAINVFRKEGGRWCLFVHQSSPVLSSDEDTPDSPGA